MARLRAISGPLAGQKIEVEREVVIGREATDLVVDDPEVSRRHAVIRLRGSELEVEDLGSSNGTFVDGKRIEVPLSVHNGAQIRVGTTVLLAEGLPPPAPPEQAVADPGATRIRRVPAVEPTRLAAAAPPAPEPTRVGQPAVVVPERTRDDAAPAAAVRPEPASEFRPPERRRKRGLASRSWVPVALSYGTAALTAIALIVYFAAR